jgi:hypothetical protein
MLAELVRNLLDNTLVSLRRTMACRSCTSRASVQYWNCAAGDDVKQGIRDPGRRVDDLVSSSICPDVPELAGVEPGPPMQPITGRSLTEIFRSTRRAAVSTRDHVLIGKKRHDVGRPRM